MIAFTGLTVQTEDFSIHPSKKELKSNELCHSKLGGITAEKIFGGGYKEENLVNQKNDDDPSMFPNMTNVCCDKCRTCMC